jgi:flavorubredoxin
MARARCSAWMADEGRAMYNVCKVAEDTWWLGANDRRIELFENTYPVPNGMSYDNYLIMDEKTCLMDGVDEAVMPQFVENLDHVLAGRSLDYLVVQHMEPDHASAIIPTLTARYPQMKVVASAKAFEIMNQFFHFDIADRTIEVKEGDTLELGKHMLNFVQAPMVHWPEVIVSYDSYSKVLFSADAFGEFGALGGNIFADEVDWERDWKDEARRYYTNIVGKYGLQTKMLLGKASKLDIQTICPLHGHVWRKDLGVILDLYTKWATYTPEDKAVAIFYGSIYGHTANAAEILARKLADAGVRDVRVYDASKTTVSELVSQSFRCSNLVFASSTYNMGIFDSMRKLLEDLCAHALCNRTVGVIYNGSWAPMAGQLLEQKIGTMKNMTVLDPKVHVTSAVSEENLEQLQELADSIVASMKD